MPPTAVISESMILRPSASVSIASSLAFRSRSVLSIIVISSDFTSIAYLLSTESFPPPSIVREPLADNPS